MSSGSNETKYIKLIEMDKVTDPHLPLIAS